MGFPTWAIGVLVAAFVFTIATVIYSIRRRQGFGGGRGCCGDRATIHYPTLQNQQQTAAPYTMNTIVAPPPYPQTTAYPQTQGYPHEAHTFDPQPHPPQYGGVSNSTVVYPNAPPPIGFAPQQNQKY